MPVRRVPVTKEVSADGLRCVSSFDRWIVGVTPSMDRGAAYCRDADGENLLVNAFSRKVIRLPLLSSYRYNFSANSGKSLRIMVDTPYTASLRQVVLCNAAGSGSKYIVAASSNRTGARAQLALWQPGMISWHICSGAVINGPIDLIRHYIDDFQNSQILKVEVFALDVSTNPCRLTEIHSFNGDCIFVGSGGCNSFPAGLYAGFEGDLIYFVPDYCKPHDRFVYSMRDGRMRPFAAKLFDCYFAVPEENLDFPVWLLPSE